MSKTVSVPESNELMPMEGKGLAQFTMQLLDSFKYNVYKNCNSSI